MFRKLPPAQLAADIAMAVLLLMLTLSISVITLPPVTTHDVGSILAWSGALISHIVLWTAAAFRRLSPSIALVLAWVGAFVEMAFLMLPSFGNIAILFVLFATAAYGSPPTRRWGLISVGAGTVIATIYLAFVNISVEPTALAIIIGLVFVSAAASMGLAWVCGLFVHFRIRSRETEQARAVAEAVAAVEQQRVRIARDMHDVVAHSLAVVIAQADGARYAAATDPAVASTALRTISTTARSALTDVRLLLTQLRHSQAEGPQPTLADLEGLYAQVRAAGVDLRVDVDPVPAADPPGAVQLAVYRILQEALTNALRHGDGAGVDVRLSWFPDHVTVEVRNGIRPSEGSHAGHGLMGMRERAQLVGGRLDVGAAEGVFVVSAVIPIAPQEAA